MLYKLRKDKSGALQPIGSSTLEMEGWKEKDLENYLHSHLHAIVEQSLLVIGQSTPGLPEVDLLALDGQGDLWFFELKRGGGKSQDILQVLRYSQSYSRLSLNELSRIYEKYADDTSRSLTVAFCAFFGYSTPEAIEQWGSRIGKKHHLVVVTDGADDDTVHAVGHWRNHGLDMVLWPYRIYGHSQSSFLLELPDLFFGGQRLSRAEPSFFIVNTDRSEVTDLEEFMLSKHAAAAAEEQWMKKINRIEVGDRVLLYANKIGLIGLGVATPERRDDRILDTPIRYVVLREFRRMRTPISYQEFTQVYGRRPRITTLVELDREAGSKLWDFAQKRCAE